MTDCATAPLHPALADAATLLARLKRVERWGRLEGGRVASLTVAGFGRRAAVGDRVIVHGAAGPVPGEVVAFAGDHVTVMPEGRAEGLAPGARVVLAQPPALYPCAGWL